MIYRRYGSIFQSVDTDFDAKALNEIGFRRNREASFPAEEIDDRYTPIETVELEAEAEGHVQTETEELLLDRLEAQLEELRTRLPEGGILVVENVSGHDYPKVRQKMRKVVERGENRLHFAYTMSPPLRVTLYRPAD